MESEYQSFSDLFPMRMTSIEKFHWLDATDEYPNVLFTRIRFNHRIDPVLARQAWQLTIQRQPFSDVEPCRINGQWHWVQGPRGGSDSSEPSSSFEDWNGTHFNWQESSVPPTTWRYREHLTHSPTGSCLSVFVSPSLSDDGQTNGGYVSEVWLYVHHALGDGAAAVMVVNEWKMIYANLLAKRSYDTGLHRYDVNLLKSRNKLGLLSWRYLKHLWKQPVALFGAAKFAFRKTVELIPARSPETKNHGCHPAIMGRWLSQETLVKLNQHARSNRVTLNTVMLGQLYLALADWRASRGGHSEDDWLRIILPISIRNISDRRMPATNRATIVQIDRRERDAKKLSDFYRGIDREIKVIRGWQLDKMFLIAVRVMSVFEPLLLRSAKDEKSRGTAVFTNLGEPLRKSHRAGARDLSLGSPLPVVDFDCVGPIRRGTAVNFSVSKFDKTMRVSLHFDSKLLTSEEALGLLEMYVGRLGKV